MKPPKRVRLLYESVQAAIVFVSDPPLLACVIRGAFAWAGAQERILESLRICYKYDVAFITESTHCRGHELER